MPERPRKFDRITASYLDWLAGRSRPIRAPVAGRTPAGLHIPGRQGPVLAKVHGDSSPYGYTIVRPYDTGSGWAFAQTGATVDGKAIEINGRTGQDGRIVELLESFGGWRVFRAGCDCATPWLVRVRGCSLTAVEGARVRIYTSPGGTLAFDGTTDASGTVSWTATGGAGAYRVLVEADGYATVDSVRTVSGTLFIDLTPDSTHACCTRGACNKPLPKTLYLTDDVGTAAMTYVPPPFGPRWTLCRQAPVEVSYSLTPYGGCVLTSGVATFLWTLLCPNPSASWLEPCCWLCNPGGGYTPVGKRYTSAEWTLQLDFGVVILGDAPFYDGDCGWNTTHPRCVFINSPGCAPVNPSFPGGGLGIPISIRRPALPLTGGDGPLPDPDPPPTHCGEALTLEFEMPSQLFPIVHSPECNLCGPSPRFCLGQTSVGLGYDWTADFCTLSNPVGTNILISA